MNTHPVVCSHLLCLRVVGAENRVHFQPLQCINKQAANLQKSCSVNFYARNVSNLLDTVTDCGWIVEGKVGRYGDVDLHLEPVLEEKQLLNVAEHNVFLDADKTPVSIVMYAM